MTKKETTKFVVQIIISIASAIYGLLDKQSSIIIEWSRILLTRNDTRKPSSPTLSQ